jgi:streptogramin lyase
MKQSIKSSRTLAKSSLTVAIIAIAAHNTLAANSLNSAAEIVFTDSQSAILRADMATRAPAVVASGQKLSQPFGICVGQTGEFFVTDTGCSAVLGINPQTGNQRVVASNSSLGAPFGIAAEAAGTILVANAQALLRINPDTGEQTMLASGGYLKVPLSVAVGENGDIFVADALGAVVQINPRTGAQTPVTTGGYLQRPQGIAVHGKDIYVTDVATADGNFGVGRIVHVDAHTGEQSVLSEGGYLVGPVGITIEQNGNLIVSDPYTINEASVDLFDGGIIALDSKSGQQNLIARGKDGFVNPRCVALVRNAGQ